MSAPQPPNQPGDGGQQPAQGASGGPHQQQDLPFGDAPEPTQVVAPGHAQTADAGATQVVSPAQGDEATGAESTQLVPPAMQPAIPYTPPPSAADNPGAVHQQTYGQPNTFPPPAQGGFPPHQQQPYSGGFPPPPQAPYSGGFPPPPPQAPYSGGFPPPQGGFGQHGYPYWQQPGFGQPSFPGPPRGGQLAEWFPRVAAYLIDVAPILVVVILGLIGGALSDVLGALLYFVGYLAFLGWMIYNRWLQQGRTGQSYGKKIMKLKLIGEQTGQPIGPGMAFVRDVAHALDSLAFFVGYLWPLWDEKKQTFADKIMTTVVVTVDVPGPSNGFGQQGGYGQPPSGGFPQQGAPGGYGQPPYGQPQYGQPPAGGFPPPGQPGGGYGQPPYQR